MKLNNYELKNIKAGAISGWLIAGIISGLTFIIGVIDGYVRPYKCR